MILLNCIRIECAPLFRVARSNAYGQISLFTYRRELHKAPKLTVDSIGTPSTTSATFTTTTTTTTTTGRPKREDFGHTKHDSAFSEWKPLIGASDWKDRSNGKEGAENYRKKNLPNCTSSPGVYEFGICTSPLRPGRGSCKLDSSSIIPVYVGQANNVRTRLQQYGRDGAHLENAFSNEEFTNSQGVSFIKGPGLFSEIFSEGFSIVYRCALMKSKKDAEKTEDQLLEKYDYAWNKRRNGERRPDDIRRKLDCGAKTFKFSLLPMLHKSFLQKQVGDRIRTCNSFLLEKRCNSATHMDSKDISSRICRNTRLKPRRIQPGCSDDWTDVCGVAIGNGSICTEPPVEGRKRCAEHKGMKVNGLISKLKREGNASFIAASTGSKYSS